MNHRITTLVFALVTLSTSACKRKGSQSPDVRSAAVNAAQPVLAQQTLTPTAGAGNPAPIAAPPPPVERDPLWPAWLPVIPGVRRRMGTGSFFEGNAEMNVLVLLVRARQTLEAQGYTLSQTDVQRQPWEDRFTFTASRGDEFLLLKVIGSTSRPMFATIGATSGALARSLMRRPRR